MVKLTPETKGPYKVQKDKYGVYIVGKSPKIAIAEFRDELGDPLKDATAIAEAMNNYPSVVELLNKIKTTSTDKQTVKQVTSCLKKLGILEQVKS